MLNDVYNLPKLGFVGGQSQTFLFYLLTPSGRAYDANGCDVAFSVTNYQNKSGDPLLVKQARLMLGESGVPNIAVVDLLAEDTVNMYGRYVYQISVRDSSDETEIPGQGIIDITSNIHRAFVSQP